MNAERPGPLRDLSISVPWPAMLDLITSILLVLVLGTTLQQIFGVDQLEAALVRTKREHFLREFRREFAGEMERGEIRVEPHLNFVQLRFSDKVLFAFADHRLQPKGKWMLARCATVFSRAGASGYEQVQVEGHTDDIPLVRRSYPSNNWQLSTARALSVVEYLSSENPALAAALSANGYADHRPVADNSTSEGRDRNRRIEIRLLFSGARAEDPTLPRGSRR
jgi:chemotaxis protein MotB